MNACGAARFPALPSSYPNTPEPEASVFLIGDAGYLEPDNPILPQLRAALLAASRNTELVVAFLGDNVYPKGLHYTSHPGHDRDRRRLESQIDVVRGTRAKGIFIPGNHDWGYPGNRGLGQIRRQDQYLAASRRQETDVALLPSGGCPGPEFARLGQTVLLVMVDTDLWLRNAPPPASCRPGLITESLDSMRAHLSRNAVGDRRHVVVLAHHPLKTYGPHGGYFGLKDQFFPATNLWRALYIPLPFVYAILRNSGFSGQDLSGSRYTRLRQQLAAVFQDTPHQPLVYAAGHDHNLQVFDGRDFGVGYILVSGAGSKLTPVGKDDALFAAGKQHGERGFMRLDFMSDGRVLLSVITSGERACDGSPDCTATPTVRYWRWLADG